MIDLSFGEEPTAREESKIDEERLNRLIGVLTKKGPQGSVSFLIAMTYDEMTELADFIEDNALESEAVVKKLQKRLETKIALAEKHL